ncbi:general secretion pathway protein GspK [Rhodoplanes sp. Z2-YC6860]|uniref:general secretion pathway protein GspK n=1 Tax=Rhodoplanes sp. Z2-YC6860 TaxID=674703 RepID=UPI00078DEAC1|nr:type II secretion system protein GspK [Rhodoplanes sp. Z2-YC6860]AMN40697.1 general secretory pathway protein K GspK [Rhodoplanes sp. Z2-YC6860]
MRTDPRRGVVLVAVLWTVALLSALAMATSVTFREFAGIVTVDRDRLRADALLTAGLETAAGVVARLPEDRPLLESEMAFRLSTGQIRVRVTDEGGRIDIGKAPVEVLASMLRRVRAENADGIARSIVNWRTANGGAPPQASQTPATTAQNAGDAAATTGQSPQATAQNQQTNGQSQTTPRGKNDKASSKVMPFTDIRQLLNVPGVTPELVAAAAPYVTVFGGEKLNALSASPAVLAALPGLNDDSVANFIDARRNMSGDGSQLLSMLGGAQAYVIADGKKVASVVIQARVADGYSAAAQAVIVLSSQDAQPYRVLAWNPWPAALAKW